MIRQGKFFSKGALIAILSVVIIAVTFIFVNQGPTAAILSIGGLMAISVCVYTVYSPIFGFYFALVFSYFFFDIIRFLRSGLPIASGIDFLIYLTFISVLINKLSKREAFWKNCRNPIVYAYVITIAYYLIEFFNPNSVSREIYFLIFRRFATLTLFFYCSIQLLNSYERINRFFKVVLALTFLSAVYGVYQKWAGIPGYVTRYYASLGVEQQLGLLDNGEPRIASFLTDPAAYGLLMAASCAMGLSLLMGMRRLSRNRKILLGSFVVFTAMAMSYSGTRTATVMLIAEVVLFIIMTFARKITILFSMFFAMLFLVVMFAPSYGNTTLNRLKSTFQSDDESLKVRDVNREFIQPYIYEHPIGGGVGSTGVVYYEYNIGHPLAGFPTDSGLLAMALEFGWIGLLIQCITYFIMLQQGIMGYFRTKNPKFKPFYIACVLFLFGYIVGQYSQVAIGQLPGGFVLYAFTAIIISLRQLDDATPKPPILN